MLFQVGCEYFITIDTFRAQKSKRRASAPSNLLTKLNFCTYIHSNNILNELFLVQSFGLCQPFINNFVIEMIEKKNVNNRNIITIQDEF